MYGCEIWGHKESWVLKNWCFWTVVLEKTLESSLDCKEIKPINPKGNQSWIFIGRLMLKLKLQYFGQLMWKSDSLQPHGLQHTRLSCPSPTPGVYSNSCPLSRWCHPTISSSVIPFSSCLQSFPASRSFLMSQFFASDGQVLEFQLQHQSFQWTFRTDLL